MLTTPCTRHSQHNHADSNPHCSVNANGWSIIAAPAVTAVSSQQTLSKSCRIQGSAVFSLFW
jgi:hypothetical protein